MNHKATATEFSPRRKAKEKNRNHEWTLMATNKNNCKRFNRELREFTRKKTTAKDFATENTENLEKTTAKYIYPQLD